MSGALQKHRRRCYVYAMQKASRSNNASHTWHQSASSFIDLSCLGTSYGIYKTVYLPIYLFHLQCCKFYLWNLSILTNCYEYISFVYKVCKIVTSLNKTKIKSGPWAVNQNALKLKTVSKYLWKSS